MFWLFFENIECSSQDWRKVPTILTQDLDANSKNYNIVLGDRSLRSEQVGQDTIRRDRASSATCCRSYWDVGNQSTVATSHNMWRKALHGTNCNPWWWSYWKLCKMTSWLRGNFTARETLSARAAPSSDLLLWVCGQITLLSHAESAVQLTTDETPAHIAVC